MSKLFTFGCSFTKYQWPTWADLLAENYTTHIQHGSPGVGNFHIYFRVMQEVSMGNICPEDTVVIMWTSILRYDLFIHDPAGSGKWKSQGNILNGDYNQECIDKFFDPVGFYKRDVSLIHGIKLILDSIGCKYEFLSAMPLQDPILDLGFIITNVEKSSDVKSWPSTDYDVSEWFSESLGIIKPSVYEIIYNKNWYSRINEHYGFHTHEYDYNKVRGVEWPTIEDLTANRVKKEEILEEIQQEMCLIFNVRDVQKIIDEKLYMCKDMHPTTEMHREYLNTVLPDWETWQ